MARANSTLTDPTRKKPLPELREDYEYAKNEWLHVREQAADDMQYVRGNPWTHDDLDLRDGRPTVAPDEMTQYRNQVTNALRKAPRGIMYQPNGRGASSKTAEFYEGKAREIEYRSHAIEAYIGAAENVLQRSYGAFRIGIRYEHPRDVNPELYLDGFPDPDVVLPDPDIKRRHGADMRFAFVLETMRRSTFKKRFPGAAVTNFGDYVDRYKDWIIGGKRIQIAEWWRRETTSRKLHLVVFGGGLNPATQQPDDDIPQDRPMPLFADEIDAARGRLQGRRIHANRFHRDVEYPKIVKRITNGLEILETENWVGKYIPLILMHGPILWIPDGGAVKREILSLTRFAKDPWKSYCYACSQELEVLGQVPKAAAIAYKGQLAGLEADWEESLYKPKAFLYALGRVPGMKEDEERLPLPQRLEYAQAEYLQSIELVKEGFRRAIQAACGSNFLPTQAQSINDKSGAALDKIDQAATQGTYHFVDEYESAIRWGGVVLEDLIEHAYDYTGDTGVMSAKQQASSISINDPDDQESVQTAGDHLVTVTTAPSSDSEHDAAEKFLDNMVTSLGEIAQILGPQTAAYILSQSIKMRNLGPMGNELADAILPEAFKQNDGQPPDPRMAMAQHKIQELQQQLQQAQQEIQTGAAKERIKGAIQKEITLLKAQATSADKDKDRAVKLDVAAIQAKIESMAMVLEELERIGGLQENAAQRLHAAGQATLDRAHESVERVKDRMHERLTQTADHTAAASAAAQSVSADADSQARQAHIDASQSTLEAQHSADLAAAQPSEAGV